MMRFYFVCLSLARFFFRRYYFVFFLLFFAAQQFNKNEVRLSQTFNFMMDVFGFLFLFSVAHSFMHSQCVRKSLLALGYFIQNLIFVPLHNIQKVNEKISGEKEKKLSSNNAGGGYTKQCQTIIKKALFLLAHCFAHLS